MGKKEFRITSNDGTDLNAMAWTSKSPQAVVCLVHGLGEHVTRYDHVAAQFNEANMDFVGIDLRGHGDSEGARGHINNMNLFLDDVEALLIHTRKNYNDLPIVLYGHSLGGNIALSYLIRRNKDEVKCGLITSPWLKLSIQPTAIQKVLAKIGDNLLPNLTQPNGLKVEDISSVIEVQEWYANDPLNHDRISGRLFAEVNRAGLSLIDHAGDLSIPILIAHGTGDHITSHHASEEFARGADNIRLKLWDNLRHETHNEHNQEEVIGYYVDWVKKNI